MVRKYDDYGSPYHEPPYTAAEEHELYRQMAGVVAFTRPFSGKAKTETLLDPPLQQP
jgi:hypothetical protein